MRTHTQQQTYEALNGGESGGNADIAVRRLTEVPADYRDGRDEMNLVELPLASVAERRLDGRKTVVFADDVWDKDSRQYLPRELAVSGSDRYGLPTALDEDVLLACVQLSRIGEFHDREVSFSRYQLLKLLRWSDEGKSYQRLATALRRWKGITIYSNRAFYDHARKSWVNRDFGVFDNLYLYERESRSAAATGGASRFRWNEVLFDSFQSGYLKKLDWDLYCRLSSPIAKRLYRLLDKRFFHGDEVRFDLRQLAFRKIRLSENYNTAQIKRALAGAIHELEAVWDLRPARNDQRFVKLGRCQWEAVFQRRRPPSTKSAIAKASAGQADVAVELTRRGVGPATAAELVERTPAPTVQTMIELFDYYAARDEAKGPGFLVDSIRNPTKYRLPPELRAPAKSQRGRPEHVVRRRSDIVKVVEHPGTAPSAAPAEAFDAFWKLLGPDRRVEFEGAAVAAASPLKRDGFLRTRSAGEAAHAEYRRLLLVEHFQRSRGKVGPAR